MTTISSTTLFNFTDKLEYLIDNLENGFYCANTYESLPTGANGYVAPMVCFCDIPLSLIKEHFNWYGRYGIGIKRAYARSLGVNPVWYVTSENRLVTNLIKTKELPDYERKYLLPYLKKFLGYQKYKDNTYKRKKLYDEHEWRFIYDPNLVESLIGQLVIHNTENESDMRMPLDLNEIEYIIIKNETEFDKMLEKLEQLSKTKGIRYETLISKLITAKQIERDF